MQVERRVLAVLASRGKVEIALNADHDVRDLPVIADLHTGDQTRLRDTVRQNAGAAHIGLFHRALGPNTASVGADIETGPIEWRHNVRCSLDRHPCWGGAANHWRSQPRSEYPQ